MNESDNTKENRLSLLSQGMNYEKEERESGALKSPVSDEKPNPTPTPKKTKKSNSDKNKAVKEAQKNKAKGFGTLTVKDHGVNKCNQRIAKAALEFMETHCEGNQTLIFNWLLQLGIEQAEKKLKNGSVIVTPDDIPKFNDE